MLFAQETCGMDHLARMRVCRKSLLKLHFALILRANLQIVQNDQDGNGKTPFLTYNVPDVVLLC